MLVFKQQFHNSFPHMHKQTRSRCFLDEQKRSSKLKDSRKCSFCHDPAILSTNLYLFQTVSTINQLQNYPYKKTIQSLIEEKKKNIQYIQYKCIKEYIAAEEILEEYIPRRQYKEKSSQVIEFYKYYQDLPRIFVDESDYILNNYYAAKRFIFYRGLKKQLGIQAQEIEKDAKSKQKDIEKIEHDSRLLKGLSMDENNGDDSLSWSVLLMQKKLAKAIKNTSRVASSRKGLQKIDRQYTFNRLIGNRLNEVVNIKGLDDVSNIGLPPTTQTTKLNKLMDASTRLDFKTMFLKKNIPKQLTAKKSPQQVLKVHKKQKSMEDIRKTIRTSVFDSSEKKRIIGSATSSQLKFRSPYKMTEINDFKSPKRLSSGGGLKDRKKLSQKKLFASGDVSCFTQQKLNTSQDKNFTKIKNKGHHRMASEQLDSGKKLIGNWTPEDKMRITINQQNVVHILLGGPPKTKIMRKPKR